MISITTRADKGSPLTNAEVDGNFTNLKAGVEGAASAIATEATARVAADAAVVTQIESQYGVADGVATLDMDGKLPDSQVRKYAYANLAAFPSIGAAGAIYIAQDTGKLYRWVSAGVYVELATSPDEVQQYANLAAFPVSGADATVYIAADSGLMYRWNGSAYAATGLQPIPNGTMLGNVSGGTATPTALTKTQVQGIILPFVGQLSLSYSQLAHTLTSALYSQILGGSGNSINNANYSVIAGATSALIGTTSSYNCFIGGGYSGNVYGQSAALLGGYDCAATGDYAALGGGNACIAYGRCFVGGGDNNWARGSHNFIGSGFGNDTQGTHNAIPGGYDNEIASTTYAFIGSGRGNRINASGSYAFVGTGRDNQANAINATVLNGFTAIVNGNYSSVLNGLRTTVNADYATVVNGHAITAEPSAKYATILGANFYNSGEYRRSVRNPGTLAHLSCPSSLSDAVYPQHEALPLRAKTTNATPTAMACGAESLGSPSVSPALGSQLGQGKLYALCELDVVGSDGTDVYMSTVKFCVVKTAAGVNPAIAGTPTVVHSYTTAGAATWDVTIATNLSTADDLVYLNINCTGEAAKTVQWNGYLRFTRQSRA